MRKSTRSQAVAGYVCAACVMLMIWAAFPPGVHAQEVETGYGRQRGHDHSKSVNGTSVLIESFRVRGHNVTTWRKLSPRLEKYDTIVWFPDRFDPPSQDEIDKLNEWLNGGYNRTLIFIGRDYDAEVDYWNKILPMATPEEKNEILRRKATASARHSNRRAHMGDTAQCEWFELDATQPTRQISSLQGEWAKDVDASKVDITLDTRMKPLVKDRPYNPKYSQDLLSSNGEAIVTVVADKDEWTGNKIIFVTNGSFLLNVPLVNKENRKLAGKLIDECTDEGNVVFLESDEYGIPIVEDDRDEQAGRAGQWLNIWPLKLILFHFLVIGVVFMFTYIPIFGRPRKIKEDSTSDFGKHVESLGQLVRKTGDQQYALSRIKHYQDHVKRESGAK